MEESRHYNLKIRMNKIVIKLIAKRNDGVYKNLKNKVFVTNEKLWKIKNSILHFI